MDLEPSLHYPVQAQSHLHNITGGPIIFEVAISIYVFVRQYTRTQSEVGVRRASKEFNR